MKKVRLFLVTLVSFIVPALAAFAADEPIRILRVGDSITRMTAVDPTLANKLAEAGLVVDFVGAQKPASDVAGLDTDCEGYNGRPIEFFTTYQATYGDEPYSDNCPMADAIPLQKALDTYKPDLVLVMVGVNNLEGSAPQIDEAGLTAKLDNFLDRMEEWSPPGTRFVLSTVPPANDAKDPGNPNRNERHRLYGTNVVRPVFERRVAAGKPYTLADPYPAMSPEDIKDGVHPSRAGKVPLNTVWAESIKQALGVQAKAQEPAAQEPAKNSPQ
jgi:hypothetical protein